MCFLNLYQNPLALWIGRNVWHSLGLSSSTMYTWGTEAERVGDPIFQIWETWTWYLLVLILFTSVPMKLYCIYFFKKDFTYLFLERGEWREKEGAKNINVWLPLTHPLFWTWPATQACALMGIQTSDPLVCRLALNPLSHTSQGKISLCILNALLLLLQPQSKFSGKNYICRDQP